MTNSREDRWASVDDPDAVTEALERLDQMAATASERRAANQWLKLLDPGADDRVLDVGAGAGHMVHVLATALSGQGRVHALDRSAGLLDVAAKRLAQSGLSAHVQMDVGDACHLPYDDHQFDSAISRWLLLHLPEPERAIVEMCRVVRPGGKVLCVEVDWETLAIYPGDPAVTREIVQANVARQVDGRIGRRLAPLMRRTGLQRVTIHPFVATDERGDWLPFLRSRVAVAAGAGVDPEELDGWRQTVEAAVSSGQYFFSFTQYGVFGVVPPRRG